MLAILHNIRSSHNVGSIFRTADAAGVERLYLCGLTPGPLDKYDRENKRLTKVSLGAERTVAWEHAAETAAVMRVLKGRGYKILALEQSPNAISLDLVIEIPMRGKKESLNVAVAFGIAVYVSLYQHN